MAKQSRQDMNAAQCVETKRIKMRYVYLDILKILACFLVIVNHTNSRIFLRREPDALWLASLLYFFISRVAVPVFVMASGAVLLGRDEPIRKCLMRAARMAAVLVISSAVYYAAFYRSSLSLTGFGSFMLKSINEPASNALWYLYLYIGILLVLPLLRAMVRNVKPVVLLYGVILSVGLIGIQVYLSLYIPALQANKNFRAIMPQVYIGLLLAGWLIHTHLKASRLSIGLGAAAAVLFPVLNVIITCRRYSPESYYLSVEDAQSLLISGGAIGIFVFFKSIEELRPLPIRVGRILSGISMCTFGTYLMSDLLIMFTTRYYNTLSDIIPALLAVILWELALLAVGVGITWVLRKIPLVRILI